MYVVLRARQSATTARFVSANTFRLVIRPSSKGKPTDPKLREKVKEEVKNEV